MSDIDFWFELTSPRVLGAYMTARDYSIRDLAGKCLVRNRHTGRSKPLSHGTIGHLLTGRQRTCKPETALAIEKALQVPPNILFTPKVQTRREVAA